MSDTTSSAATASTTTSTTVTTTTAATVATTSSSPTYQSFAEFQSLYGKKVAGTNKQLFGHQLRQVQGCSTAVAQALMQRYHTTARFIDEMQLLGTTNAEVSKHSLLLASEGDHINYQPT